MREKVYMGDKGGFILMNISLGSIPVLLGEHSCGAKVLAKNFSEEWLIIVCQGKDCGFRLFIPQTLNSSEEMSRWASEVDRMGSSAWHNRNAMKEALRRARAGRLK